MMTSGAGAQDTPVNFEDHIYPIIDEYCLGCHRGSRARNGFKIDSVMNILEGGSSGASVVPGDPDGSLLYQVVSRTRQPFMPYEEEALPDEMVHAIKTWIAEGVRESATARPKLIDRPTVNLEVEPTTDNAPAGEPAMPQGLRRDPYWWSERANTITALAASPWSSLVAVAGHHQVVLYHTTSLERLGVLEFSEGVINTLRFSRNGDVLIAGGGRSGEHGVVVGWDVKTGARLFAIGNEPDAVLTADLTNDHRLLALGGPDRRVRVYQVASGELLYEIEKHTDWITALRFSPDGVLLATGDRVGGLFVWEADTGRAFHTLPSHAARVTEVDWRTDSLVLASCGEDSAIRLYEMNNGKQIKAWSSHGGVLALSYARDGRIATSGRDRIARLWDANGAEQRALEAMGDLATEVAITGDGGRVFVGDWNGDVAVFNAADGARVGGLRANPTTTTQEAAARAPLEVESLATQVAQLQQAATDADAALTARRQEADAAQLAARQAEEAAANAETHATELEAQSVQAEQTAEPIQESLARKQQDRDEAIANRDTARVKMQDADGQLQAALAEATSAEQAVLEAKDEAARTVAQQRLDQAITLLDGARALAQLAASDQAELDVQARVMEQALESWRAYAQPRIDATSQARVASDAARTKALATRGEADRLTGRATELTSVLGQAQAQVKATQDALAAGRHTHESARLSAVALQSAWETQRAAIAAASGRVPDLAPVAVEPESSAE